MFNYLLTSGLIHLAILLSLCLSPELNIPEASKVQVTLIQKEQNGPILPSYRKPLKLLGSGFGGKKVQKVDMTAYANQLKALVDPRWVEKIEPYQSKLNHQYEIIVLLSVDKHGNIYRVTVKKGSGDQFFDNLAVQTFREIGTVPIPPESVVKDGIEWSLVF
jgi:TonB family protein